MEGGWGLEEGGPWVCSVQTPWKPETDPGTAEGAAGIFTVFVGNGSLELEKKGYICLFKKYTCMYVCVNPLDRHPPLINN